MSYYTSLNPIVNTIITELMETDPVSPTVMPNPYQESRSLDDNITRMSQYLVRMLKRKDRLISLTIAYYIGQALECRPITPAERSLASDRLTAYYRDCCLRIFSIFEPLGVEQISRTKEVKVTLFRTLKRKEVNDLANTAMNEASAQFSQELKD